MSVHRVKVGLLVLFAAAAVPIAARAVDTVEPFGEGAVDFELYASVHGVRKRAEAVGVEATVQTGYGLSERSSLYLNAVCSMPGTPCDGGAALHFGFYRTMIDTRFFDFDLFADLGAPILEASALELSFGLELNLEFERFGLFTTLFHPPKTLLGDEGADVKSGAHCRIAEGHQLLASYEFALRAGPNVERFESLAFAVGYNAVLFDGVELITEVALDLAGEAPSAAFTAGFIVGWP